MRYPKLGSIGYCLLAVLVWRPYYWAVYRQEPELRPFMVRRRIFGGGHITPARRAQLARVLKAWRGDAS